MSFCEKPALYSSTRRSVSVALSRGRRTRSPALRTNRSMLLWRCRTARQARQRESSYICGYQPSMVPADSRFGIRRSERLRRHLARRSGSTWVTNVSTAGFNLNPLRPTSRTPGQTHIHILDRSLRGVSRGSKRRAGSYPDPVNSGVSTTVLIGRAVVIGSAWRCATFQVFPSRRKIMVTRRAIGLMFPLPPNRASARSIWTM
jgi:hypothetical protein